MTLNYTYNTKTEPMPEPIKIEESKHEGKHCIKKYYKSLEDCKNSIPNCMYFHTQLENSSIKVITGRNYFGGEMSIELIKSTKQLFSLFFANPCCSHCKTLKFNEEKADLFNNEETICSLCIINNFQFFVPTEELIKEVEKIFNDYNNSFKKLGLNINRDEKC